MSGRFLVRHPETGAEYGLSSVAAFKEIYEPQGFEIATDQPNYGDPWEAPAMPGEPPKKPAKAKSDADGE